MPVEAAQGADEVLGGGAAAAGVAAGDRRRLDLFGEFADLGARRA
jgi:hypothetical protein